jgi:hypothetical protein
LQGQRASIVPGSEIGAGTSPATKADLVDTYVLDPKTGQYNRVKVDRGSLPNASGRNPNGPPGIAGGAGASMGNGAYPGGAPPGPILAAPPQGQPENLQKDIEAYGRDKDLVSKRETSIQSLLKAKHALELTTTGRGAEAFQQMRSFINTIGGNVSGVTNYDTAHKYLLDYARTQAQAAGSNEQLNAALGSSASTSIDPYAAIDVIKTNVGRERQAIAQVLEHKNADGAGYRDHAPKFAGKTSPAGFAIDLYKPEEMAKMRAAMSPTDRAKFEESVGIALRRKQLTENGGQ